MRHWSLGAPAVQRTMLWQRVSSSSSPAQLERDVAWAGKGKHPAKTLVCPEPSATRCSFSRQQGVLGREKDLGEGGGLERRHRGRGGGRGEVLALAWPVPSNDGGAGPSPDAWRPGIQLSSRKRAPEEKEKSLPVP